MGQRNDRTSTTESGTNASRRNVIRGVAATGAAAGVGLVAAPKSQAATNEPFVLGRGNFAANITYVRNGTTAGTFATDVLTNEPTMFWVDNRLSTINGNGIRGDGHGTGSGLWGHSDFNGTGVLGTASAAGVGVKAIGGRANLQVVPAGTAPRSRGDAHSIGEIVADAAGDLWCCVLGGNPGQWRKLAGPATAGQFHVLPAPARSYDSRISGGPLGSGEERVVSLQNGRVGGGLAPAVPAGASSATVSLTITQTTLNGFVSLYRPGIAWPGNSNLNWFATGQTFAVTTVSAVDASAAVTVRGGGAGSTHFIVDVIGYYS